MQLVLPHRRSSRVAPAPDHLGLRNLQDASADSASLADHGEPPQKLGMTATMSEILHQSAWRVRRIMSNWQCSPCFVPVW